MWNGTGNQVTLVLIRHGQTKGNLRHAYIGITDEELCLEGIESLKRTKDRISDIYEEGLTNKIYVSPMKRCKQTANFLFSENRYTEIEELRETDFGEFEGKNYQELNGNLIYQQWIDSNGTLPFPGGESMEEAMDRTMKGFEKLVAEAKASKDKIDFITLVVHGGTIMTILSKLAGGNYYDYQIKNGEGYFCQLNCCDGECAITDLTLVG